VRPQHPSQLRLRALAGRAFHRISSACCRSSARSGTRCPRSASRLSPTAATAGSACRTRNVTRRASASRAGVRCRRSNVRHYAHAGRDSRTSHPVSRRGPGKATAAFSSCHPSAARCCASSGAMPHRHSASSGSSARAPNTRDTVRAHRAHTWHHRTCQGRRHITEPAAPPAFAQTRDRPFYRVTPPFAAGRTGTGTLQTSTRPAGTLNHSSRRLRRASR